MSSFKDINLDKLDIPFISQLNDKKSIRIFYKDNNIHDDILLYLEPCLCPFGLKKFEYINVVTCSLANSSRKRVKEIKDFEEKISKRLYKLYPQFKEYRLKSFLDEHYRFTLSVNINDLKTFDQKLNIIGKDNIKPQCFIEPIICLYELWIRDNDKIWGINCKLIQCKVFSPFITPNYCLFNKDITNIGEDLSRIEKMKKMGVPDGAIDHYCKLNGILPDKTTAPKINFTPGDILAVKLKEPIEKGHNSMPSRPQLNPFKPPSVNDILAMKNKLKPNGKSPKPSRDPPINPFKPPSVNDLLDMRNKLKKIT